MLAYQEYTSLPQPGTPYLVELCTVSFHICIYGSSTCNSIWKSSFIVLRTTDLSCVFFGRINFTLEDLAPASPTYKHFRQCLKKQYPFGKGTMEFSATQLSTDFPQYFQYERTKELVSSAIKSICIHCTYQYHSWLLLKRLAIHDYCMQYFFSVEKYVDCPQRVG